MNSILHGCKHVPAGNYDNKNLPLNSFTYNKMVKIDFLFAYSFIISTGKQVARTLDELII